MRWVATGRLSPDDVYRVTLTESESGASYAAETRELFYIIPDNWLAPDLSLRQFAWHVSVLDTSSGRVSHSTDARAIRWQNACQPGA